MLKILIDADMIVFRACAAVEKTIHWYGDLWTLHSDAAEAKAGVDELVVSFVDKVMRHYDYEGSYEIIMCFSDEDNFRKRVLPTYKLNRGQKRRPLCFGAVKEWVQDNFKTCQMQGLEADDCIGILATEPSGDLKVIISGDKDFKTIPGYFYDFMRDSYYELSEAEADYWHYYQSLIGDRTDNYTGCPGIGAVRAKRLLDDNASWSTVVEAYEKAGLTEEDALQQARVARILRYCDYDRKAQKPILWEPPV